jgi:hypothetical protein
MRLLGPHPAKALQDCLWSAKGLLMPLQEAAHLFTYGTAN